jgi:hypothetical protein
MPDFTLEKEVLAIYKTPVDIYRRELKKHQKLNWPQIKSDQG